MKPIVTTLVMAFIALGTSSVAWYFYPRIEVEQDVIREQLLTEDQAFQPRDVRKVRIEQFDRSRNSPAEFDFRLESGSWVIPSRANYPANNTVRVASAVNAMRDKEVLEVVSDNKNDHEEYGVLAMSELGATGLGAGTEFTFEGRNRKRLGKLIVGSSPEGKENQRYVRLAGQPQIYVIEFDNSILTTKFSDWVDGVLIQIGGDPTRLPDLIKHIDIDLYYMNQADSSQKKTNYRARIIHTDENRWLYDLWQPDEDQKISDEPTIVNQEVDLNTLSGFVQQLMRFDIRDVSRKQDVASIDLADPKESQSSSHFDSLKTRGFYHVGFERGQHQFDSAAGEITIAFRFGMEIKMYFGAMAAADFSGGGQINRFLMLNANMNHELIPEPVKPTESGTAPNEENDEPETEDQAGEQESEEDQQRKYQVALNRRSDLLGVAERESRSSNQVHADWVYVIPEDVVSRLFPPADSWKKKVN